MNSDDHDDTLVQKAKRRVAEEVRRFALLFFYLWALFLLFVLNEDIALRQRGFDISIQGFALVNSLILAKVMLVVEDLNLGRWFRQRPLIYPILQEALLLTVLFICFHFLEHIVIGLFKRESIAASVPNIGGGGLLGLGLVSLTLFIALLPFFAFKHIGREIGEDRLREMLFGTQTEGRE